MQYIVNETPDGTAGREYSWTLEVEGTSYDAFKNKGSVELPATVATVAAIRGKSLFSPGQKPPLLVDATLSHEAVNLVVVALGYIPECIETFDGEVLDIDLAIAESTLNELKENQQQDFILLDSLKKRESDLAQIMMTKGTLKKKGDKLELENVRARWSEVYNASDRNYEQAKQESLNALAANL